MMSCGMAVGPVPIVRKEKTLESVEPDGTISTSKVWSLGLAADGRLGTNVDIEDKRPPEEVALAS
eukprot:3976394-Amphidinium_carterae.1